MKLSILLASFILFCEGSEAQTLFSKGGSFDAENYVNGSSAWGDYNNDGFLDLIKIGTPDGNSRARLFKNNGNGTFSENTKAGLANIAVGDVAWGDYNNDGFLDLVISASLVVNPQGIISGEQKTKLYKNLGNETFVEVNAGLQNVAGGTVEWGDIDHDGDLDLYISGYLRLQPSTEVSTSLYRNDGNDIFTKTALPFVQGAEKTAAWGDHDNDGDLDLVMTGTNKQVNVYSNQGDGTFTLIQTLDHRAIVIEWGDYNGDRYLDLLISGYKNDGTTNPLLAVYKNNGTGTFSKLSNPDLAGGVLPDATHWMDFDNDGDLDIIAVSGSGINWEVVLYTNNGNDVFASTPNSGLPHDMAAIDLLDIDKDGDLDVYFFSKFVSNTATSIYINNSVKKNTAPKMPTGPNVTAVEDNISFSWNKSTDNETTQNSISYNLYLRNKTDTIISAQSLKNGFRKINQLGNAQLTTTYTMKKPAPGDYYWGVQAVDNSFMASMFTQEQGFTISNGKIIIHPIIVHPTSQTITFSTLPDKTMGDHPFNLTATASSGLEIIYSTTSDNVALSRNEVLLKKPGRVSIKASQPGDSLFLPALPVEQSFCINPVTPIITPIFLGEDLNPTLTSSSATGNQWYLNRVAINGAKNSSITATETGSYTVQVSMDDCKSKHSTEILVTAQSSVEVEPFPNPTDVILRLALGWTGTKSIHIIRSDGRTIERLTTNDQELSVSVEQYTSGLYYIYIQSDKGTSTRRFVKK